MYLRAIRMWGCLRHVPRHRVLGIVTAFLLHASLRCRRRGAVASGWLYNCQTRTRCFVRRTLRGGALPCTRRWSRTDLRTTAHRRCKIRIHRDRSSRPLPQRQASRRVMSVGDRRSCRFRPFVTATLHDVTPPSFTVLRPRLLRHASHIHLARRGVVVLDPLGGAVASRLRT
jgi:hypothetical protein